MNNILFIIGNGFNFFTSEYLKNPVYKEIIQEKVNEKSNRADKYKWIPLCSEKLDEYCHLMENISVDNSSGELLLSKINNLYKSLNGENELDELNSAVKRTVQSKINNVVYSKDNFVNIVQTVRTLFNQYGNINTNTGQMKSFAISLYNQLKALEFKNAYIYTTNYDKIVDEVFTEKRNLKLLNIDIIDLHGHYKSNIICCDPNEKENKIDKTIMYTFKQRLNETEVIVLFGLGLTSDPHILNSLNNQQNKNIIIIDSSKYGYFKEKNKRTQKDVIGYDFLYNNDVYFLSTRDFDFINNKLCKPIETPEELLNNLLNVIENIKWKKEEVL